VQALGLRFDLTPGFFYTDLQDSFTLEKPDPTSDTYIRKNSTGARVIGGEFDISAQSKGLDISMGFSYQQSEYDQAQEVLSGLKEKTMLRAPEMTGNITAIYEWHPVTLSTDMVLYGPMKTLHETAGEVVTTDTFYEWGTRVAYEFYHKESTSWEIFAGIKNILNEYQEDLDKGYARDAGYVYGPALPRTFYLGLKGRM
jgi:outer membrane receptor for ferrienterochelin and colicins